MINFSVRLFLCGLLLACLCSDVSAQRRLTMEELMGTVHAKPPPGYVPPPPPQPEPTTQLTPLEPAVLEKLLETVKATIVRELNETESVTFGQIFEGRPYSDDRIICGEVNAKNSDGDYGAVSGFIYLVGQRRAEIISKKSLLDDIAKFAKSCPTLSHRMPLGRK